MNSTVSYQEALDNYQANHELPLPEAELSMDELLKQFHPDHYQDSLTTLEIGPNKGGRCHRQLADVLQADALIDEADLAAANVTETDILVIGGGGAGAAAALTAARKGARVILATKLRLGDSNTIMAEGGIQASVDREDSPQAHYQDTMKAGHYQSDRDLVAEMALDGPDVIRWLIQQGMNFDLNEFGDLMTRRPGGATADRVVYYRDYTGLEMMRVLREAVRNCRNITVVDNAPALELLGNESGHCAGAVFYSTTKHLFSIIKAQQVIMATGGIGRMHLNNFPTTNHFGATGDGLVMAYRLGAKLRELDSFQYHPTTVAYPEHLSGSLITEGVRSSGVYLLNAYGERFVDELKPRDQVSAAILRECQEGRGIRVSDQQAGVWLDTPGMELREPGLLEKRFPKLFHMAGRADIDPRTTPMLVYPGLHYQNGGVMIDKFGKTTVPGLYCVGELSGGIHGRNRIMGNALLEIISFGRRAGEDAANYVHGRGHKKTSIEHVSNIRREIVKAGLSMRKKSPLLFPKCAGFVLENEKY